MLKRNAVTGVLTAVVLSALSPVWGQDPTSPSRNHFFEYSLQKNSLHNTTATGQSGEAEEPAANKFAGVSLEPPTYPAALKQDVEKSIYPSIEPPTPTKKAPVKPWKPLFYDNDFSYMSDPDHTCLLGEGLKDVPLHSVGPFGLFDNARVSVGGELRYRHMNERNRLRPNGPGKSTYDLWRWRNYVDLHVNDSLRFYFEVIDASIFNEDLPAVPIDINRWNVQNAFVDLKLAEHDGRPIYFRFGRQELLYGAQRLISPLDWGNTRRNFEGFKLFHKGEDWDIDAFATRPVNTATGNGPLARFDHESDRADASRTFSGIYAVNHAIENHRFDFYWLWLREQEERANRKDGSRHTVGARWSGKHPVKNECCEVSRIWSFDLEGAYQFGHDNDLTVDAGFFTANLGHTWKTLPWQPKLTALYYWGSGDRDPTDDKDNTFSVLFPLGHAYWGFMDNLSGQNLKDYSIQMAVKPTKKLTLLTAMHWFDLARDSDVLYNVVGAPLGTPGTGTEIGEELDLVATYVFNPNFNVQVGYSWFWNGTFIQNNLPRDKATQFYLQTSLRY